MPKCFCYNERKASLSLRTSAGEDICESTCSNQDTLSRAFLINASAPPDTPLHPPTTWQLGHSGGIVKICELCGRKHCSSIFAVIEWHNRKTLEFSVDWRCCSVSTCLLLHLYLRRKFVLFMFITSPHSVEQHYYSIIPLSLLPYSANIIKPKKTCWQKICTGYRHHLAPHRPLVPTKQPHLLRSPKGERK